MVCNEALDDAAFTSPPKRSKVSAAPASGKQQQRQQPDGEPCASTSGRATLQVEAGDYECSICLQILVDPVVGESELWRFASQRETSFPRSIFSREKLHVVQSIG